MKPCYTADQIRRGEQPLLAAQAEPDALMQQAAFAVFEVAEHMLSTGSARNSGQRVLLLVGSGGNGGDALYAGANLLARGFSVDARIFGARPHQRALAAFLSAGGRVLDEPLTELMWQLSDNYALLIDGIVGIGGKGPLREEPAWIIREAILMAVPVLAVDIPSGVAADSGETFPGPRNTLNADPDVPEEVSAVLPGHVTAAVTVTFGGLRYAHAVSPACGTVVLADIGLPNRGDFSPDQDASCTLGQVLSQQVELLSEVATERTSATTGHTSASENTSATGHTSASNRWRVKYTQAVPEYRRRGQVTLSGAVHAAFSSSFTDLEPQFSDDKYSGGVVGIAAGSERYPGAAVLCATAAVRATSSAVHFFGGCAAEVVRALPSVVAREKIVNPRVNAWVVGPGRGVDDAAVDELEALLLADEPLVIDADAITVLAQHTHLQGLVRERALRDAVTVLTPHAGEFVRLRAGLAGHPDVDATCAPPPEDQTTGIPDPDADPIHAAQAMAAALRCTVLLKGHRTVVATPPRSALAGLGAGLSVGPDAGEDTVAGLGAGLGAGPDAGEDAAADPVFPGVVTVIDAGSSWAATPGSGDVLSGLLGAWLARGEVGQPHAGAVETAVAIHARAAEIAARTQYGYAPTDAASIAEAIRPATAFVLSHTVDS